MKPNRVNSNFINGGFDPGQTPEMAGGSTIQFHTIALDAATAVDLIPLAGSSVRVFRATTDANITLQTDQNNFPGITLQQGDGWEGIPFRFLRASWTAQAGGSITLAVYGNPAGEPGQLPRLQVSQGMSNAGGGSGGSGGSGAWEKIGDSISPDAGDTSFGFAEIPQTYRHLLITAMLIPNLPGTPRNDGSARVRFNGTSGGFEIDSNLGSNRNGLNGLVVRTHGNWTDWDANPYFAQFQIWFWNYRDLPLPIDGGCQMRRFQLFAQGCNVNNFGAVQYFNTNPLTEIDFEAVSLAFDGQCVAELYGIN